MMRFTLALSAIAVVLASGCANSSEQPPDSPEQAVREHIAAAEGGDVAALRRLACGSLAEQLAVRDDEQVRTAFQRYYEPKPDQFGASAPVRDSVSVLGFYTGITDLDISFVTERHGRWQVCEIHKGNGPFGPLPGPFG